MSLADILSLLKPSYHQHARALRLRTPLGPDTLLAVGFEGTENISEPYRYEIKALALNEDMVPFERLLGNKLTIELEIPGGLYRPISGICSEISEGARDLHFTEFRLEMVPSLWLLGKRVQTRIFQHLSVPEILKKVLRGVNVSWELEGTYEPRNYCAQYDESDLDFASRLMEEEGIFYFFEHEVGQHRMIVADSPKVHLPLDGDPTLLYRRHSQDTNEHIRVDTWNKAQRLRSGKLTTTDYAFQLNGSSLEASETLRTEAMVGCVPHKLTAPNNELLEIYDPHGRFAARFDGINATGGDRSSDLGKVGPDGRRTNKLRAETEAANALRVRGSSRYRHLAAGRSFVMLDHPNADGMYVLAKTRHRCKIAIDYRSSNFGEFTYENEFECLPSAVPFRPDRKTPRPRVSGPQTATVVGPAGEEIFTDPQGRVKVQFHWDREGARNPDSSCWMRVAQVAAGATFGAIHIPRVGQEVVVSFENGDPDRPIVTGCVYNPNQPPPFPLPDKKMISGWRTNSYPGGGGFNEFSLDDTKGRERMFIHAEYNQDTVVKHDQTLDVGNDSTRRVRRDLKETVDRDRTRAVGRDEKIDVGSNQTETIGANLAQTVGADATIRIAGNKVEAVGQSSTENVGATKTLAAGGAYNLSVGSNFKTAVDGDADTRVSGDDQTMVAGKSATRVGGDAVLAVGGSLTETAREISLGALAKLTLTCGASTIELTPASITIRGPIVKINC